MRDHRAMHMQRALGRAGGAAGEMQQGRVVGLGVDGGEGVRGGVHPALPVQCARFIGHVVVGHQQHMAQRGHLRPNGLDLALVQAGGGDQHLA